MRQKVSACAMFDLVCNSQHGPQTLANRIHAFHKLSMGKICNFFLFNTSSVTTKNHLAAKLMRPEGELKVEGMIC